MLVSLFASCPSHFPPLLFYNPVSYVRAPSLCFSLCLSPFPCLCPSVSLCICRCVSLFSYLTTSLSLRVFVSLSLSLFLSLSLCFCRSAPLPFCFSVCFSVSSPPPFSFHFLSFFLSFPHSLSPSPYLSLSSSLYVSLAFTSTNKQNTPARTNERVHTCTIVFCYC